MATPVTFGGWYGDGSAFPEATFSLVPALELPRLSFEN
jgi:hypothetical protein